MKPECDAICPACKRKFLANDHEVGENQVQCPCCGYTGTFEYPPTYFQELGCGPLALAFVVFLALAAATGGGGLFGILAGIALGLGIPAALAWLIYTVLMSLDK